MEAPVIVEVITSGDAGGGQLVSLKVSRELARRGYQVRFATPTLGPFTTLAGVVGTVDVIAENSLRDLPRVRRISTYLKTVKASLVHTHTPIAASLLWRIGARMAGVPVVHHVHTGNFYGPPGIKSYIARKLDRMTARYPHKFIAVSKHTAQGIIADGYPPAKVRVSYNSISWGKQPRVSLPDSATPVISCVGRVARIKGQLDLVDAFSVVHRRFPGAVLWIIGAMQNGEDEHWHVLENRIAELELTDPVKLLGHRDDVHSLIEQSTVLVLPSGDEAFPLVLLEAMSIGIPVIATPVGGVPELVIHDETGLLTPIGSPKDLAAAIERLLGHPELREQVASNAYRYVWENFNDDVTLHPVVSILEDAVISAHSD